MVNGYLFPGAPPVRLVNDSLLWGGSWEGHPVTMPPLAWGCELIQRVYGYLSPISDAVLVDVGASTGSYSLLPALLPALTVYAFEPNPEVVAILQRNVALNQLQARVIVRECALGAVADMVELHVPIDRLAAGLATLGQLPDDHRWTNYRAVQIPLDALGLPRVDVLKIDAECAEKFILQGARATIERCRPVLLVEASPSTLGVVGYEPQDIPALITEYGYHIETVGGGNLWCQPI